ncbi:MAG: hypothetical protein J5548_14505 [Prevotella sp.]|nr:hypothetical protein [Prevotella sp.]
MGFIYHPLFREGVILAAIILLAVYCVDKSRQNQRTRNALYNCAYVLYAAATGKAIQIIELVWTTRAWREALGLIIITTAAFGYAKWLKPQRDIPYNKVFYILGWGVIAILFIIQAALLLMVCFRKIEN